jgi:hypothetical protein
MERFHGVYLLSIELAFPVTPMTALSPAYYSGLKVKVWVTVAPFAMPGKRCASNMA